MRLRIKHGLAPDIDSIFSREFICTELTIFFSFPRVFSYFRAMFGTEMAEKSQERITLNGVEPAMIHLIVQYAYTSEINITKNNVQSLLSAANLLQV